MKEVVRQQAKPQGTDSPSYNGSEGGMTFSLSRIDYLPMTFSLSVDTHLQPSCNIYLTVIIYYTSTCPIRYKRG